MNRLSMKMKLAGSFGLMIVILIFMGVYSVYSLGKVNEKSTEIANNWLPGIAAVGKIKDNVDLIRIYEYKHVVETSIVQMKKIEEDKKKAAQEIEAGIAAYRKLIQETGNGQQSVTDKDTQLIGDLEEAWRAYEKIDEQMIALSAAERQPEAMALINGSSVQSYEHLSDHTNELVAYNSENAHLASDEGDAIYANTGKVTTIVIALAVLFSVGIAYSMIRMFSKPLGELMRVSMEAAKGNLGVRAEVYSHDELGRLSDAYNETLTSMGQLIAQIQNTSEQVAAASEELTASAEQSAMVSQQVAQNISTVSAASTQQLNAVESASGTIDQMSIGIGHAATGANDSAQHAAGAVDKAKEGGMAIEKAVVQMNNIEITVNRSAEVVTKLGERSKEIGQIVETISGIAGQTNLLALNAAIEAARAGEQGRGFAVVAEEVRKLAEQSQEAAERISSLIASIQQETEEAVQAMNEGTEEVKLGAAVVNDGGNAFQELADMAVSISRQAQDISAVIQELSSSTDHIVTSVKDVDEASRNIASESQTVAAATEEQSASMEEIASSSRNLAQLAQTLQAATQRFSL